MITALQAHAPESTEIRLRLWLDATEFPTYSLLSSSDPLTLIAVHDNCIVFVKLVLAQ